jgi:hypothetical protein
MANDKQEFEEPITCEQCMTNHPKFTESHDSAARSVGYEGARESR